MRRAARGTLWFLLLWFSVSAASAQSLAEEHRAWLEDEVEYIITDREREVFLSLESKAERDAFIRVFWRNRDPIAATPHNEYQDEHYLRLAHADEHFRDIRSRPGRKTDRGRMYVLLGQPRSVEAFDNYNEIFTAELWFYGADSSQGLPPFFYLLFFKPQDVGTFRLYSPVIDTPSALVRGNRGVATENAVEALYGVSQELGRASLSFDATAPVNRADVSIARLGTEQLIAGIESLPTRTVRTDYLEGWRRYGKRVSAEYSFNYVPNRSSFAVSLGPDGSHYLNYAVELDFDHFPMETDENRTKFYTTVDVSLEVRDGEGALVVADDKESYVELSAAQVERGSGEAFSYQDGFPIIPGSFTVSVILRNRLLQQYTVAEESLVIPPMPGGSPAMSDLVIGFALAQNDGQSTTAVSSELATFEIQGHRVQPAADGLFAIGSTAYLVCQLQNVAPDQTLRFDLYLGNELVRTDELDSAELTSEPIVHRLALAELDGGEYVLHARLVDTEGTTLVERRQSLSLSPRTAVPRPGFTVRRSFDVYEPGLLDLTLGDQLWAIGRYDEAQTRFERAVDAANPALDVAKWKLGGAYIRSGEPNEALALFEPLVVSYPEQYEVVLGLGLAYYLTGRLDEAARFLAQAIELKDPGTSLLNALGDVYLRLKRPAEARPLFERSLELDPDQEKIRAAVAAMGDVQPR